MWLEPYTPFYLELRRRIIRHEMSSAEPVLQLTEAPTGGFARFVSSSPVSICLPTPLTIWQEELRQQAEEALVYEQMHPRDPNNPEDIVEPVINELGVEDEAGPDLDHDVVDRQDQPVLEE